jgi:hypothetical protein
LKAFRAAATAMSTSSGPAEYTEQMSLSSLPPCQHVDNALLVK